MPCLFQRLYGLLWLVLPVTLVLRAAAAAPDDGRIAAWAFDGSLRAADGSGAAGLAPHPGDAAAPVFAAAGAIPGARGQAVALGLAPGAASSLVATNDGAAVTGPDYTLEAWIHPVWAGGQAPAWARLVLRWGAAPRYAWHLAVHEGAVSLYHGQADGALVQAEGGRVEAGCWQHVAGVARRNPADPRASRLEVYLDGRLVGEAPFDGTLHPAAGERLGLGDSAGIASAGSRFRGYLDDVAVWNRALSAGELRAHYEARAGELRALNEARQLAVREERARQLAPLALPAVEIVFAERNPGRDPSGHYYANFGYACGDTNEWLHGADGGRLCALQLRTGAHRVLLDDPGGAVRDPCVRYDGSRILFAYRKGGTHVYHLYEIHADGSGLRQITDGPWDDIEPAYLPDGDIVFCSSRCKRYVLCWLAPVALLCRCDADGRNPRLLSSGSVTESTPSILPDGRVLYTRWEYVNRDAVSFHHLWTMNPDGTAAMTYFGNMRPGGVFIDAQPVPGSGQVVYVDSGYHGQNEHMGTLMLLAPGRGPDTVARASVLAAGRYRDPFPLDAQRFLAAVDRTLVLVGPGGRAVPIHQGARMVHEPRLLTPRPREPVLPVRTDPALATGTLLLTDVREGRNMAGVQPGAIRSLLVLEDLPKPVNFHGGGTTPIAHGGSWTIKRILGTVPVEADGSAHFDVPACRSVYFAALDAEGRCVKQMRSFVTLQPGERAGCVGCHEDRARLALPGGAGARLAARRPPSTPVPVPDVPPVLDFPRDVQPILDRHCVGCHDAAKRKGGVVLTGDRGPTYSLAYYNLLLHRQIRDGAGYRWEGLSNIGGRPGGNDAPGTTFSSAAPLMRKVDGSHHDVRLTAAERAVVRLWLDVATPYAGTYAAYGSGQIGGWWRVNACVREMADDWPSTPPAREAMQRRCAVCHGNRLPRFVTDQIAMDGYQDFEGWQRPVSRFSRHTIFNLTRPEQSLALLAPLAREAGGYAVGAAPAPTPVPDDLPRAPRPVVHPVIFASTADPDYARVLDHLRAAGARLDAIKRFDMPGFRPNVHYVREMRRYGVLPPAFDAARDVCDVYATDARYWQSFWHQPVVLVNSVSVNGEQ